jgi:hypothetical protein
LHFLSILNLVYHIDIGAGNFAIACSLASLGCHLAHSASTVLSPQRMEICAIAALGLAENNA